MKRTKTLVASLIALVLCFTMVIGTTFAWFTDSVTNTNTIITSGNVDVELWHSANSQTTYTEVNGSTKLFVNTIGSDIIWEPGTSATENFQIKNVGSLALKYQFSIKAIAKTATEDGKTLADILTLSIAGEEVNHSAFFGNGYTIEADILAGEDPHDYTVSIAWDRDVLKNLEEYEANDYNVTNGLKIYLGIELVATQLSYENDGTGNNFDDEALFPNVSSNVSFDSNLQEDGSAVLQTKGENPVTATIPSSVVETLIDNGVESLALVHTEPQVDEENKTVTFESVELVDEEGNIIDLIGNNEPIEVTLPLPVEFEIEEGMPVDIFHDGEKIASAYVAKNGTITYQTNHFCEVAVERVDAIKVSTADELIKALSEGNDHIIVVAGTYTFPAGNYFNKSVTIKCEKGVIFEGTSKLNIKGSTIIGATFKNDNGTAVDQTINAILKDCIFTGNNALRWCYAGETVVFENCVFDGAVYGVHFDGGANDVVFKNCSLSGFNAMGAAITNLVFEGCSFVANGRSNYNGINLWGSVEMTDCTFVFDGSVGNEWVDVRGNNITATFTDCLIFNGETEQVLISENVGNFGEGNAIIVK